MSRRKFIVKNRRKRKILFSILFVVLLFIGVGYSTLSTKLMIGGSLEVSRIPCNPDSTLYSVLKCAADNRELASEYTGLHQDSMNESLSTEKIYHWRAENDNEATAINDKNNVIFAGYCWKTIRTTDTGGVKLVYNGEVEAGQCNESRGYHPVFREEKVVELSPSYYYGTDFDNIGTYSSYTMNSFYLTGTVTTGSIKEKQFTCKLTNGSGSCNELYYVLSHKEGSNYYVLVLRLYSNLRSIGNVPFVYKDEDSISKVGYMYNSVYPDYALMIRNYINDDQWKIDSSYYYSDRIEYNTSVSNQYSLVNPQLISSLSDFSDLKEKYVINGTSGTTAYYVNALNNAKTYAYYRKLENGNLTTSMMIGSSYIDNGDSTYTIQNASLVTFSDWYNSPNIGNYTKMYVCEGTSATCQNVIRIGDNPYKSYYNYLDIENWTFQYAEDVIYENGTYHLTGDIITMWDLYDSNNHSNLTSHRYTCMTTGDTCTKVKFITLFSCFYYAYVELHDVDNIEDALYNMVDDENLNQIDSSVKVVVEDWYKRKLLPYSSYIEDTIFCNNRRIDDYGLFTIRSNMSLSSASSDYFRFHDADSLKCDREIDSFSISNSKALLNYPVGLPNYYEMKLLNNNELRRDASNDYWLMDAKLYDGSGAAVKYVDYDGSLGWGASLELSEGVKPTISLIPGVEYSSGDGSMANPYIISTN